MPSLCTIFRAAAFAVPVALGAYIYNDHNNDLKLKKQAEIEQQERLEELKRQFHFDNKGNKRGSLEFAYSRLKETIDEKHQRFYDAAENARSQGVHPLPLLLVMANETGLNNFNGDDKNAQGYYQNQTLFFIENSQKYARNTEFYRNQNSDSPIKWAIDSIVDDPTLKDDDQRRKRAEGMRVGFKTSNFEPDTMDIEFLALRDDPVFSTQLMAQKIAVEYPQCTQENLPTDATQALEIIKECVRDIYGDHLRGEMGNKYLNALAVEAPDLRIKDIEAVQAVANTIQERNGWKYPFSAASWVDKSKENGGPFSDRENTRLGDIPQYFEDYINLKTSLVMNKLSTIVEIADPEKGQTFENYLTSGDDVLATFDRKPTIVETSKRPKTAGVRESLRPKTRPDHTAKATTPAPRSG